MLTGRECLRSHWGSMNQKATLVAPTLSWAPGRGLVGVRPLGLCSACLLPRLGKLLSLLFAGRLARRLACWGSGKPPQLSWAFRPLTDGLPTPLPWGKVHAERARCQLSPHHGLWCLNPDERWVSQDRGGAPVLCHCPTTARLSRADTPVSRRESLPFFI